MANPAPPSPLTPPLPGGTNAIPDLDIRGIKDPVALPGEWAWLWWLAGVLAAAGLAWWCWRRWRKKLGEIPATIIIPPHRRARERLNHALTLIHQPEPFCVAVSNALRVYLEERFTLHAPERTTEEFLGELQNSSLLTIKQKESVATFLTRCDMVKFAQDEPTEIELRKLFDAAMTLVDETEPSAIVSAEAPAGPPEPPPVAITPVKT